MTQNGRRALVTGAGGAIGGAIARALATDGYSVGLCDRDAAVEEVRESLAGTHAARIFDVANREASEAAMDEMAGELGGPFDTLVTAAAIVDNIASASEFPPESWERELAVNLSGAFWCARALAPAMLERGFGRIVVLSSGAGLVGQPRQVAYSATKAGLLGLVRTLAAEFAPQGVTCNAVLPGLIATPRIEGWTRLQERVPVGRFGRTDEVASLVRFLCSDEAAYITGACIPVDGGLWLNSMVS